MKDKNKKKHKKNIEEKPVKKDKPVDKEEKEKSIFGHRMGTQAAYMDKLINKGFSVKGLVKKLMEKWPKNNTDANKTRMKVFVHKANLIKHGHKISINKGKFAVE